MLELRACDAWGPTAEWTIRTFASAMHREQRQPEALVHDHGTHFLGQFERQLRVLEIERRRTPVALPFVNGSCERAVKSVRLEMLNHVRVRDVEELQWYLDEYRVYCNEHRANQAIGGETPMAFGRDSRTPDTGAGDDRDPCGISARPRRILSVVSDRLPPGSLPPRAVIPGTCGGNGSTNRSEMAAGMSGDLDSPGAEVISLDEVRRRKLVRRSFAHGLLNAYELVDEESAAA